jgi:BlaI family transcriptional regulator, penicillinase repressor
MHPGRNYEEVRKNIPTSCHQNASRSCQKKELAMNRNDPMGPKIGPKPTEAELAILQVLWHRGQSTVAEVQEVLNEARQTGYTTVLKFLQIMTEKALVTRDESRRAHVYRAAMEETEIQQQLVGDLLERAFGGSASSLVLQALSARRASPHELLEIRQLLDKMEGDAP